MAYSYPLRASNKNIRIYFYENKSDKYFRQNTFCIKWYFSAQYSVFPNLADSAIRSPISRGSCDADLCKQNRRQRRYHQRSEPLYRDENYSYRRLLRVYDTAVYYLLFLYNL